MSKSKKSSGQNNLFHNVFAFKALNPKQEEYIRAIVESSIIFAVGSAGVGKSIVPTIIGLQHLESGKTNKLVFSRPTVELHSNESKGLGYLPGDMEEKMRPYLRPVMSQMEKYLNKATIDTLFRQGKIECIPLEYIRGNTFDNTYVILDEAQNASYNQIKSLLTRIGKNGKIILNGDIEQNDVSGKTGLEIWKNLLTGHEEIAIIEFGLGDIVRHGIIADILRIARKHEREEQERKNNVRNITNGRQFGQQDFFVHY